MVRFLTSAEDTVKQLRVQSSDTMELLRNLYAYFGERYDGNDPVKILGTLSSFLDLYAKSVKQYQVCSRFIQFVSCRSALTRQCTHH
jgi:hypothetical protein